MVQKKKEYRFTNGANLTDKEGKERRYEAGQKVPDDVTPEQLAALKSLNAIKPIKETK